MKETKLRRRKEIHIESLFVCDSVILFSFFVPFYLLFILRICVIFLWKSFLFQPNQTVYTRELQIMQLDH